MNLQETSIWLARRLDRFVKWVFSCPEDRKLIMVWKEKREEYALGQTESITAVSIGRYKIIEWVTFYTPVADWKKINK